MSMLQHNLIDFSVEAYHDGALETIGKEDLLGHWSVLFFYPARTRRFHHRPRGQGGGL